MNRHVSIDAATTLRPLSQGENRRTALWSSILIVITLATIAFVALDTSLTPEQRIALDLLLDPEVGIVSLGGRAGTGKSALALCAGLEAVL